MRATGILSFFCFFVGLFLSPAYLSHKKRNVVCGDRKKTSDRKVIFLSPTFLSLTFLTKVDENVDENTFFFLTKLPSLLVHPNYYIIV